jgi:hypothetical protein
MSLISAGSISLDSTFSFIFDCKEIYLGIPLDYLLFENVFIDCNYIWFGFVACLGWTLDDPRPGFPPVSGHSL